MADACVPHQHPQHCRQHYWRLLLVIFFFAASRCPLASSFAANPPRRRQQQRPTETGGRSSSSSSASTTTTHQSWIAELQKCRTAHETIERICRQLPQHQQQQQQQGRRRSAGAVTSTGNGSTPASSSSSLYSLILVRLSRQLLLSAATSNNSNSTTMRGSSRGGNSPETHVLDVAAIRKMVIGLVTEPPPPAFLSITRQHDEHDDEKYKYWTAQCSWLPDCVEGTKAAAIIARSLSLLSSDQQPSPYNEQHKNADHDAPAHQQLGIPLRDFWSSVLSSSSGDRDPDMLISLLTPSAMTGLKWAMDTFAALVVGETDSHSNLDSHQYDLPPAFRTAYDTLDIPFAVVPNGLTATLPRQTGAHHDDDDNIYMTIPSLVAEVDFRADTIQTTATQRSVRERRYTAWQGDAGVAPFAYSGKSMERDDWTPTVLTIRNLLHESVSAGRQYYDGCLLNYYPNGESAMRYHRDPDQGTLWDYDTAVVSIGSPRPFSFRKRCTRTVGDDDHDDIGNNGHKQQQEEEEIHNFVVFHGDVTHMFADCQARFEHTVKKAAVSDSPRISLVFKRSFGL
jgi:alkylated DNA repair dioxygenase AlkB